MSLNVTLKDAMHRQWRSLCPCARVYVWILHVTDMEKLVEDHTEELMMEELAEFQSDQQKKSCTEEEEEGNKLAVM